MKSKKTIICKTSFACMVVYRVKTYLTKFQRISIDIACRGTPHISKSGGNLNLAAGCSGAARRCEKRAFIVSIS